MSLTICGESLSEAFRPSNFEQLMAFSIGRGYERNEHTLALLNAAFPPKETSWGEPRSSFYCRTEGRSDGKPANLHIDYHLGEKESLDEAIERFKAALPHLVIISDEVQVNSAQRVLFFVNHAEYLANRAAQADAKDWRDNPLSDEDKRRKALYETHKTRVELDFSNSTVCKIVEQDTGEEEVIPERRIRKTIKRVVCEPEDTLPGEAGAVEGSDPQDDAALERLMEEERDSDDL